MSNRTVFKKLLIVGGTGRNVGKTECICHLIERCSAQRQHPVYGLKISAIFPDERLYHGTHQHDGAVVELFEETDRESEKDTSRMLRAGAARVFYLRAEGDAILPAFNRLIEQFTDHPTWICESNSLADHVRPAVLIMVKNASGAIKERSRANLAAADLIIVSDGHSGFPELCRVAVDDSGQWFVGPSTCRDHDLP